MAKLFLRNVGSHPELDLEVTLFKDGELQFETDNGHINIAREGVKELVDFLLAEILPTPLAIDKDYCNHNWSFPPEFCPICNKRVPMMRIVTKA